MMHDISLGLNSHVSKVCLYLLTGPFPLPFQHLFQCSILWQAWSQYMSCIITQDWWTHAAFTRQLGQGFWYIVLEPLVSTSGSINPVSG